MFDRLRTFWSLWSLYEEVKTMDVQALVKIGIAFLGGAVAALVACVLLPCPEGTTPCVVSWSHCLTAALAPGGVTAWAYVKQSPLGK